MQTLKRIGILSVALVATIGYAIIGLIVGILIALFGGLISTLPQASQAGLGLVGLGIAAIIVAPIIYGIIGFIAGLIGGLLYNLAAKWTGGVKIELTGAPVGPVKKK